jgi:hypothetical protein
LAHVYQDLILNLLKDDQRLDSIFSLANNKRNRLFSTPTSRIAHAETDDSVHASHGSPREARLAEAAGEEGKEIFVRD